MNILISLLIGMIIGNIISVFIEIQEAKIAFQISVHQALLIFIGLALLKIFRYKIVKE